MDQNLNHGQVHEQNLNHNKEHKKSRSFRDRLPSDKKKLILLSLIVLAIPLTVSLALYQQEIRSRAGGFPATPATPPNPSGRLYSFATDHARLDVDELSININGVSFSPINGTNLKINSSSPYPPSLSDTTLELTWQEKGVEMRMFMYFNKDSNNQWYIKEIWTYNGKNPGDWIYYDGFPGGKVGESFDTPNLDLKSRTGTNYNATIHFGKPYIKPFLVQIPSTGYYIYRSNSNIKMPISIQNSGYIAYTFLYKDGQVVNDQTGLSYQWKNEDTTVAQVKPFAESYDCQSNKISPCPISRISVVGLKPGSTKAYLVIYDSNQRVVATTDIAITVEGNSSTPTPSKPAPTPLPTLTNNYTVRFQGTYVGSNLAPLTLPGQKIMITNLNTNQTFETAASPSWSSPTYPRGKYRVTAAQIPGYKVLSNVCQNCNFHSSYTEGNPVLEFDSTNAPAGYNYYDIGFQYVPLTKKVTLYPNADAYVGSTAPNKNYGTTTNLKNDLNPEEISYIRFNLSTLAGKTIKSARLVLWTSDATSSTLNLRRAEDKSWTETGITYNNRPSLVSTITSFNAKTLNSSVSLDVKSPVNNYKGTRVTFGIKSLADDSGAFYSRNAIDASKRPQLVVEYQ